MSTGSKLRIGIIGAGNIGGTLTRRLTALGHDVAVANSRGPETLADLAAETGGLDESGRQQPGTPVYGTDHAAEGVRRALAEASPGRTPEWRASANSPGAFESPA